MKNRQPNISSLARLYGEIVPDRGVTKYSIWQDEQSIVDRANFESYIGEPISRGDITDGHYVVINSIPKAGSLWMQAMLACLLKIDSNSQIHLSHVGDLHSIDSTMPTALGTVVLVRDMRDVVHNWYHEISRLDIIVGFSSPRYPDVRSFYFEYLIGCLCSSPRYNYGCLESWLDLVTGRGYPLVRYEDLKINATSALEKVLKFWKIIVPKDAILQVTKSLPYSRFANDDGTFPDHKNEHGILLPEIVLEDIEKRFGAYQLRLGYQERTVFTGKAT